MLDSEAILVNRPHEHEWVINYGRSYENFSADLRCAAYVSIITINLVKDGKDTVSSSCNNGDTLETLISSP